jgi:uncharacterized Tic20 family protein
MGIVHSPLYVITLGLFWAWFGVYVSSNFKLSSTAHYYFPQLITIFYPTSSSRRRSESDEGHPIDLDLDSSNLHSISNYNDANEKSPPSSTKLNFFQSWLLVFSGMILHFQLDILFEDKDPFYLWILSTGFNGPGANDVHPAVAVMFALTLSSLLLWMVFIQSSLSNPWLKSSSPAGSSGSGNAHEIQLKRLFYSFLGVMVILFVYLAFVGVRMSYKPKIPAVGEEADFGVLVFYVIFQILPLISCFLSCDSRCI